MKEIKSNRSSQISVRMTPIERMLIENKAQKSGYSMTKSCRKGYDKNMSYVDPKLRPYFESLSIDLKNEILKQDVEIKSLSDLIQCLDRIVKAG